MEKLVNEIELYSTNYWPPQSIKALAEVGQVEF